ncbi:MAG: hypothetical protein WA151_05045, partial [Desulfatirhabdiaceae bacterium]
MAPIYENVTALVQEKFATSMDYTSTAYDRAMELINGLESAIVTPNFSMEDLSISPISASFPENAEIPVPPIIIHSGASASPDP